MLKLLTSTVFLFLIVVLSPAHARTWYVTVDSTGDAPTIKAAIDSSSNGDSILVAAGTYFENLSIFGKDDLTLISEAGSLATVLDGSMPPKDQILTVSNCSNFRVQGFTIQNGRPGTIAGDYGGGMYVTGSDVHVHGNIFINCKNKWGGAIGFLTLTDASGTEIVDNIFRDNEAGQKGSAIVAAYVDGPITVERCQFIENSMNTGAIVFFSEATGVNVLDCLFDSNGAYPLVGQDFALNGITSVNNLGAGVNVSSSTVANCLAYGNEYGFQVICGTTLSCNNAWGNSIYDWDPGCSPVGTNGNISQDPLFCDADNGDYSIAAESPCAPAQSGCGLIGAYDVGCIATHVPAAPVGRTEETSWTELKTLFR